MGFSTLLCEVRDHIGFITLNRPEKRNALKLAHQSIRGKSVTLSSKLRLNGW